MRQPWSHKVIYWTSTICIDGESHDLGAFPTREEAEEAYMGALRECGYEALRDAPDGVWVETKRIDMESYDYI